MMDTGCILLREIFLLLLSYWSAWQHRVIWSGAFGRFAHPIPDEGCHSPGKVSCRWYGTVLSLRNSACIPSMRNSKQISPFPGVSENRIIDHERDEHTCFWSPGLCVRSAALVPFWPWNGVPS